MGVLINHIVCRVLVGVLKLNESSLVSTAWAFYVNHTSMKQ